MLVVVLVLLLLVMMMLCERVTVGLLRVALAAEVFRPALLITLPVPRVSPAPHTKQVARHISNACGLLLSPCQRPPLLHLLHL